MSSATRLLEGVLDAVRQGNTPDPDTLVQVETTIRQVSPNLSSAELRALLGLVNEVQDAIQQEKESVQAELDRLASERKALRGYAQLRSHRHSQRVNRKT